MYSKGIPAYYVIFHRQMRTNCLYTQMPNIFVVIPQAVRACQNTNDTKVH